MPDKAWKRLEREVARYFGVRRIPVGEDNQRRVKRGDVELPWFYVSCRLRARGSIERWFREAKRAADKADLMPLLVVRRPRRPVTLAVVELDTVRLLGAQASHFYNEMIAREISKKLLRRRRHE